MEQRRQTARVATLQDAQIVLATGEHLDCTIENISTSGVLLRVADATILPSTFDLAFSGDGETVRCDVAWTGAHQVGAAFQLPTAFPQVAISPAAISQAA